MLLLRRPLRFALFLALLCPGILRAVTIDPEGPVVTMLAPAPAIVGGNPAIAWTETDTNRLRYARATDASGTAWGPAVTVAQTEYLEEKVSLRVVAGNPAVCYNDFATATLWYARAANAEGTAWNAPVKIAQGHEDGALAVLEVAGGFPAICYRASAELRFVRATDATGTAWGTPVTIDNNIFYYNISIRLIQDRPAVAYNNLFEMKFALAADATGSAWGTPVVVGSLVGLNAFSTSMEIVNGRPAIVFPRYDDLLYTRALDAEGSAWSPPHTVVTSPDRAFRPSLAVVNGKPAIGYQASSLFDIRYVQALDSDGGAWGAPVPVDGSGVPGWALSLFEVTGSPVLIYHDTTLGHLKYIRPASPSGLQWPAELLVRVPDEPPALHHGDVKVFERVGVNQTKSATFTLLNPAAGSVDLTISNWTLDGADAAEFSILPAPAVTTVPGGGSLAVTVRYAPVTPGIKTAVLRILSNAATRPVYDIMLRGESEPDIELSLPEGPVLTDGSPVWLPVTPSGTSRDITFSISNSGVSDLRDLTFAFDGPDRGEFSVALAPASIVLPAASTVFTLRHTPLTAGAKTAGLHLSSNVSGDKNPYDLTVRMVTGLPDPSFRPITGSLLSVAVQADGNILTGGFEKLERFKPDGTPDNNFFAPPIDGTVNCIAVQKDGRILIGGVYQHAGGQERPGLARLLPDGSLDTAFAPGFTSGVRCLALQPDGKIIAGGISILSPSNVVPRLTRLHADGSPDAAFAPSPGGPVYCLALQPEGKILVAGEFFNIPETPPTHLMRLNPDGTTDPFAADPGLVACLALQPDGRILTGGNFENGLARFLPDGTVDPSFDARLLSRVNDLAIQADGRLLVAFGMNLEGGYPARSVVSLLPDGSIDPGFNPPGTGLVVSTVQRIALQSDSRALLAIQPQFVGGPAPGNFVRLQNDFAPAPLQTSGNSTVRWLRSSAAPEVNDVTFDVKPAGATGWTRLGSAHRISDGWELSGLALPPSGQIRAQAFAGGSVIESLSTLLTPLESWRLQVFNSSANTGDAADDADPDHDGLTNFTEFAFGLSPVDRGNSSLPSFTHTGPAFAATFTAPEGREDVVYRAEWSPDMRPGTWINVPDTGTGRGHVFTLPAGADRQFVRFVLRMR